MSFLNISKWLFQLGFLLLNLLWINDMFSEGIGDGFLSICVSLIIWGIVYLYIGIIFD